MKRIITLTVIVLSLVVGLVSIGGRIVAAGQSSTQQSVEQSHAATQLGEWDFDQRVEEIRAEETARLANRPDQPIQPTSDTILEEQLIQAIIHLQPTYARKRHRARRLASIILEPAAEYGVNPFIALAVAMKESSLLADQEGELGEEGYFQVMPRGYARRVCSGGCELSSPRCNARTAICFLDHRRTECGSTDPTMYVLAYSTNKCPTNWVFAAKSRPVRRGRGFLVQAVGDERADELWPM